MRDVKATLGELSEKPNNAGQNGPWVNDFRRAQFTVDRPRQNASLFLGSPIAQVDFEWHRCIYRDTICVMCLAPFTQGEES